MICNKKNTKLNKGFTLIEVLVAIIILAVVCIPVFRAISTAYKTTAKSTLKMKATNAAENIMEDIKSMSVDEVVLKYGLQKPVPSKKDTDYKDQLKQIRKEIDEYAKVPGRKDGSDNVAYKMVVNAPVEGLFDEDLNLALSDGYEATITIDPSYYTNSNRLNLAEYNAVSATTSAIYSMDPSLDTKTYKEYDAEHEKYKKAHPDLVEAHLVDDTYDFESNLKREIRVDIKDVGDFVDEDGNTQDKVTVDVRVSYLLTDEDNNNVVTDGYEEMIKVDRRIFDNSSSEQPLSAIFIMYFPRYEAAKDNGDIIIVHNWNNIEVPLYIVAQNTNDSRYDDYLSESNGGLNLLIHEHKNSDNEEPISIRTNLLDDTKVEYAKDLDNSAKGKDRQVPMKCFLTVSNDSAEGKSDYFNDKVYKKIKKGKFEDKNISYELKVGALDGKTGDASTIEDRIFDVIVNVKKTTVSDEWPVSVELTGTILEKSNDK